MVVCSGDKKLRGRTVVALEYRARQILLSQCWPGSKIRPDAWSFLPTSCSWQPLPQPDSGTYIVSNSSTEDNRTASDNHTERPERSGRLCG